MFGQIIRNVFFGRGKKQTAISLDSVLESADKHLENFETLIPPAPQSKPRTSFNPDIPPSEMSMMNLTLRQRLRFATKAVPVMYNMHKGAQMYDGKRRATRHEATAEFIAELEEMAYQMGVESIGYVKVPSYAIFQDKGLPCDYAIVFTVEMDKEPMETAPSFECQLEVIEGYKNMAAISKKLAQHLRRHGYDAYPGTALGGITDYPHLAELAGLGAIGYHGLLIGPGAGARVRINTIYTNISNLPTLEAQERENEHLWVRDFCAMCRKCIRKCPVEAIYDEPRPRGDGGMQTIEHATCRDYFAANFGCGVCLAVCPFSHTGYEQIEAKFKGNPHAPQFRIPVEG
ncbi:MAG: hypothetical protein OT477_07960 [Chloroflexi bacterium]|nr:hypothetical protein [Chloroflexota bacterium]